MKIYIYNMSLKKNSQETVGFGGKGRNIAVLR